jgi:hypothetical protein
MRVVEHRPVACVPSRDVLRYLAISGLQTRWAHRLNVYILFTRACRRNPYDVYTRTKITPNVLGKLRMTGAHGDVLRVSRRLYQNRGGLLPDLR